MTSRASRQQPKAEPSIYTFRVRILGGFYAPPEARFIWREIEVAADQTLADLGQAIPDAFDFDDPHLWSFFLSGKAWDEDTEYTVNPSVPFAGPGIFEEVPERPADEILIRDVPYPGKTGKREFLFLFDYGDEWHFGVKLLRTGPKTDAAAQYPRVVASAGASPSQYPENDEWDEDEKDEEDDEQARSAEGDGADGHASPEHP